jgi:hypothetical protein
MQKIDELISNLKMVPIVPSECHPISLGSYYESLNDFYADLYALQVAGLYYNYTDIETWNRILYFVNNMISIILKSKELNLDIGKNELFDDVIKAILGYYNGLECIDDRKNINWKRLRRIDAFKQLHDLYNSVRIPKTPQKESFANIDDFIFKQEIITLDAFTLGSIKNKVHCVSFYEKEYDLYCDLRKFALGRNISLYKRNYLIYISNSLLPKLESAFSKEEIVKYELNELIMLLRMFANSFKKNSEIYLENENIIKYLKMGHKIKKINNNLLKSNGYMI